MDAQVQIVVSAKDQASSVLKKVGGSATDLAKTLAVGLAAGGAAVAAGLGVTVNAAAGFEQRMSAVKAVSGATASEMAQLSGKALQLGKDTSFSASEAASGLEALVKGGVTIPEIMTGAAEATLALAAAGGVDLANAAEIAANALNTFNLSGADMENVANKIAGAANASTIDVNDFRLSMAAAGAVTALVGGSFDDMAVAITAMGNAGIKGSDAGTSLKSMLLNLNPITDKQVGLMRELGIVTNDGANKFFDAQGSLKSFADVSQVLQDALVGQTDQQKLATLETLFGSDAIRAAAVFAEQGADGFNTLAESIGKISAADVAATRLDNLKGDLEQLGGAAEVAAITLGTSFQAPLRAVTQGLTEFINNGLTPFIETHGPAFAQAALDAGKGLGEFLETTKNAASQGLEAFGTKLDEIGASAASWAAEHGAAGKAVELSLSGVHGVAQALQFLLAGNFNAAMVTAAASMGSFQGAADNAAIAVDELRTAIERLSVTRVIISDLSSVSEDLGRTWSNLTSIAAGLLGNILPVGVATAVAGENTGFLATAAKAAFAPLVVMSDSAKRATDAALILGRGLSTAGEAIGAIVPLFSSAEKAGQTLAGALDIVGAAFGALAATAGEAIGSMVASVTAGLAGLAASAAAAMGELAAMIGSTLGGLAGSAGAQARAIGASIVSGLAGGITAGVRWVADAAANLVSSAMAAARNALPGGEPHSPWPAFTALGVNVAEGLAAGIEDGATLAQDAAAELAESVSEAMTTEIESVRPEAERAGADLGQSVAEAIGAGLGKVKTIEAGVDSLKGTVAGAMRDLVGEVDKLNRDTERKFTEVGQKVAYGLQDAATDAARAVQDVIGDVADRISGMQADLALSRVISGRRDTFSSGQNAATRARSDKISDEDLKRSRTRDAEDIERDRSRDDAETAVRLRRDLERAKTAEERAGIIERASEAQDDLLRRRRAEDEDLAYRRRREDEDRAERRKREGEDRAFSQSQDAARQAFDDTLENEALGRSIERANQDRDARIKALNEALVEKQSKIREDAATEQAELLAATKLKTQTLKDEFTANLPPLLAGAQEIVNSFLLGIDQAFERVAGLASGAAAATGTVGAAFGTTAAAAQTMADQFGISVEQAKQIIGDGGNFAKSVLGTDIPGEFAVTDKAVEEFAHKFGIGWDEARRILEEGGRISDLVMGKTIPKAAAETATAVAKAGTAAVDLKVPVKDAQGALETLAKEGFDNARSATDKAKDAATQISAVLQGLDDKMPHLVQQIKDFGAELAKLPREIVVNIRTVGSVNAGAGSGGGGGGGGDGGSGSNGSEFSQEFLSDQSNRADLRGDYNVGQNDDGSYWVEPKAKGGPVKRDEPYLVGERGPEIFTPKKNGWIVPNDKAAMAARLLAADTSMSRWQGGPVSPGQRYLTGEAGAELFMPRQPSSSPVGGGFTINEDSLARKIAAELAKVIPTSIGVDDVHSALVRKSGRNGGTLGF